VPTVFTLHTTTPWAMALKPRMDIAEVVLDRAQEDARIIPSSQYGPEAVATGAEPTIPAAGA
jgi:hypothetical protein